MFDCIPSQHHAGSVAWHSKTAIIHGDDPKLKLLCSGLAGEGNVGFEGDGDLGPFGEGGVGGGLFAAFDEVGADAAVAFAGDGGGSPSFPSFTLVITHILCFFGIILPHAVSCL